MIKKKLVVPILIIETILLYLIVFQFGKDGKNISFSTSILAIDIGFNFALASGSITMSTTFFGFILSLYNNLLLKKKRAKLAKLSIVFASVGILSNLNEVLRYIYLYSFQITAGIASLCCVFDWISYGKRTNDLTVNVNESITV